MTRLVSFQNAALGYGHIPVSIGLTLGVPRGQVLALVGPDGGGKTTLMRGIAGSCSPLSGSVEAEAGCIGLVPQSADLDLVSPVSVAEVVTMEPIAEAGWGRRITADMRAQVGAFLDCANLVDWASHRFRTLSDGQHQRVLTARALVVRPDLIMIDEPFNGLGVPSRDIITGLIADLTADGIGVVVSTHDLSLTRDVRSRAYMPTSRLVALGLTNEVLAPDILARAYGASVDEAITSLP